MTSIRRRKPSSAGMMTCKSGRYHGLRRVRRLGRWQRQPRIGSVAVGKSAELLVRLLDGMESATLIVIRHLADTCGECDDTSIRPHATSLAQVTDRVAVGFGPNDSQLRRDSRGT